MRKMNHYSLEELQNMINLKNTDLCLALIQLIQDKKVERGKDKNGVYCKYQMKNAPHTN